MSFDTSLDHDAAERLPVIAIGTSAGGLEASRALLRNIPGDTQAAFVLIQHLDPLHHSMMVDLLAPHTELKVVQAAEGLALQPGCLYVIPPGVFLTVAQHVLHLSEPEDGKSVRLPFDVLLHSLATDTTARPGCIVLSGTGTDGSLGSVEIHAVGGLVIAQDPTEASYSGMPDSAIATGSVAQILPIDQIPAALKHFLETDPAPAPLAPAQSDADKAK